jgi:hypothetical protein
MKCLGKYLHVDIIIVTKLYTCICHVNILCSIIIGTACLKLTEGNTYHSQYVEAV